MTEPRGYVLGQSERAARRLEIQDAHFAEDSEQLLDDLGLRPDDRVVEIGCGPGGFSRRILRRLGPGGVLVAVDASESLLAQARAHLAGEGAKIQHVLADVAQLGSWLDGADVVVGRAVLHHIPLVERMLGQLRTRVRPGTRVGFLEPDFRSPLGRLGYLEATTQPEVAPLRVWATVINQLYQANRVSPDVGASLVRTLVLAGYQNVHGHWSACASDSRMLENITMFYDEVRDKLPTLGILSAAEITEQQRLLSTLTAETLPPAWGIHRVAGAA